MRLKFIGTNAERSWLAGQLRAYIRRSRPREPNKHPESGLYTVYYDVKTPCINGENLSNHAEKACNTPTDVL